MCNEMFYCEVSGGGLDDIYNKLFNGIESSFVVAEHSVTIKYLLLDLTLKTGEF